MIDAAALASLLSMGPDADASGEKLLTAWEFRASSAWKDITRCRSGILTKNRYRDKPIDRARRVGIERMPKILTSNYPTIAYPEIRSCPLRQFSLDNE